MESRRDAAIDRASISKPKSPKGGKALQRLFQFLGQRDVLLNNEVVAATQAPKAARPKIGLSDEAKTAAAGIVTSAAQRSRLHQAAEAYAAERAKAATAIDATIATAAPGASAVAPWTSLGPTHIPNGQTYGTNRVDVIGRVAALAVDPSNGNHVLCGAAGGGIWETKDGGATWAPRTDQMPSLAIGAIAFDPHDPSLVYAGSGEGNFYASLGAGVYRSADGGSTWSVVASAPFVGRGFFALAISPADPKTLYAATTDGFYASTDSGRTWTSKRSGRCWSVSVDAGSAKTEILATFADGLWVSTNGGNTFSAVALPTSPTTPWTRIAVDRVAARPDVAYAFGAAGGRPYLWRRSGTKWSRITQLPAINVNQAWYDWHVAAPGDDPNTVYLGAIDLYRGTLNGTTWAWRNISTNDQNSIHPDQHCLAFAPNLTATIYAGCDGGVFCSEDRGGTWKSLNVGLGITEISYLGSDPATSNWLMAGTQDNGTIRYAGSTAWDHIADGDGGDCGVNALQPNEVYHSYYGVSLEKSVNKGNSWTALNPPPMQALFYPPVEVFGQTVAIAGANLDVSRNAGSSWTTVSLGLGSNELATAMHMPDADHIHVGTSQGHVVLVAWNGANWTVSGLASPFNAYTSCIRVDPSNPNRIWVTSTQVNIGAGAVSRSDNAGASWTACASSLPSLPMNSVVVDPADTKRVWVAADVGVYETLDSGVSWAVFSSGLPNALAADLVFHAKDRKLICATRNRGVWSVSVPPATGQGSPLVA